MAKFFKGTEKRQFVYPTIIEERKGNRSYWPLIIGLGLVAIIAVFFFIL
jgi:hypothetical protein